MTPPCVDTRQRLAGVARPARALRRALGSRDTERVAAVLARLGVTHAPERRAGRVPASER